MEWGQAITPSLNTTLYETNTPPYRRMLLRWSRSRLRLLLVAHLVAHLVAGRVDVDVERPGGGPCPSHLQSLLGWTLRTRTTLLHLV